MGWRRGAWGGGGSAGLGGGGRGGAGWGASAASAANRRAVSGFVSNGMWDRIGGLTSMAECYEVWSGGRCGGSWSEVVWRAR